MLRPNVPADPPEYDRPTWNAQYSHREFVERYYGEIRHLDAAFRRLLDVVDQAGLRENTYVIFTSDHGEMMRSHGLYGKGVMYEESARVPLIIRGPGIEPGRTTRALFGTVDFMPTLLALCGLPPAARAEGLSHAPLVRGLAQPVHESVIMEYHGLCIRRGAVKLIADAQAARAEALHNLESDPYEMTNRVGDPELGEVRRRAGPA